MLANTFSPWPSLKYILNSFHNIYDTPKTCIIFPNNLLICCSRKLTLDTRNYSYTQLKTIPKITQAD